jgi:capsular exopolysaccharide synthesis family protein
MLLTNLEFLQIDGRLRTIVTADTSPDYVDPPVALGLGAAISRTGKRVAVIDANLSEARLHEILGLPNDRGLTGALLELPGSALSYVCETGIAGLRVLPSGHVPPNPIELLRSRRLANVLDELREWADVIVVDAGPVKAGPEALLLSVGCDALVLVAQAGSTRREQLSGASHSLAHGGSTPVGVMLVDVPSQEVARYKDRQSGDAALAVTVHPLLEAVKMRASRLVGHYPAGSRLITGTNDGDR